MYVHLVCGGCAVRGPRVVIGALTLPTSRRWYSLVSWIPISFIACLTIMSSQGRSLFVVASRMNFQSMKVLDYNIWMPSIVKWQALTIPHLIRVVLWYNRSFGWELVVFANNTFHVRIKDMLNWVCTSMNLHRMFFIRTPAPIPSMHWKLTKHGKCCTQNSQLSTKTPVECKDGSMIAIYLWTQKPSPIYGDSTLSPRCFWADLGFIHENTLCYDFLVDRDSLLSTRLHLLISTQSDFARNLMKNSYHPV